MRANAATETGTFPRDVENTPNLSKKKEREKTRGEEREEELGVPGEGRVYLLDFIAGILEENS